MLLHLFCALPLEHFTSLYCGTMDARNAALRIECIKCTITCTQPFSDLHPTGLLSALISVEVFEGSGSEILDTDVASGRRHAAATITNPSHHQMRGRPQIFSFWRASGPRVTVHFSPASKAR